MRKKKTTTKKAFVPITINKSNLIINAIGHPSVTAQKIFNMALKYIDIDRKLSPAELRYFKEIELKSGVDFSSGIVSNFNQSDFLRLIPGRNNAWVETRDRLFSRDKGLVTEYTVSIPDETGSYSTGITPLITGAYYDDNLKKIYIKFQDSEVMRKELTTLSRYTRLTLNIESRFKSSYTIRIYEILESYIGKEDWKSSQNHWSTDGIYEYQIGTERLKWMIGAIYVKEVVDDDEMKKDLKKMQTYINNQVDLCKSDEDYDRIREKYGEWLSDTKWDHFKSNILERAIKELNENKEYIGKTYTYQPVKVGRRYKYINFIVSEVQPELDVVVDEVVTDDGKDKAIAEIRVILDKNKLYSEAISNSQCFTLAKAVGYNYEKFATVYDAFIEYADSQEMGISSPVGLLINMIKNDAEPNTKVSYKSAIYSELDSMNQNVEIAKRLIRTAQYSTDNLDDEEKQFIEKNKQYIGISFGFSLSQSKATTLETICKVLKKTDDLAKTIYEEDGQLSMFME